MGFDQIVGKLEDIAVSDAFQDLMLGFCRANCLSFEDKEENKLEYTAVFNRWTEGIESFIERKLREEFPDFSTSGFLHQLSVRPNIEKELMEEVLELLVSLSDFPTFKALMLSHKKAVTGAIGVDSSNRTELSLSGKATRIHC